MVTKAMIIVVEDDRIIANEIKRMLEGLGYSVNTVLPSDSKAIKKIKDTNPDLILMDTMSKADKDVVEMAEQISSNFNVPIVFITTHSDDKTLRRARLKKPYSYVLKPLEERELYTTIELVLYKNSIERKIKEETENALATIMGCAELMIEEGEKRHDPGTLHKVDLIRNAAYMIQGFIDKI